MGETLLTIPEAADRLRVHRATVYRLIAAGLIDTIRLGTGVRARVRISETAMAKLIRAQTRPGRKTA